MRTIRTNMIGDITNRAFKKSKLTVSQFIETLKDVSIAFDYSDTSYHIIDNDEIVYVYFAGGRWNAKY